MRSELDFTITFHGPFRVSTGMAARGADISVDLSDPLPATSLKGLMRNAAVVFLGLEETIVESVFGSASSPSPWSWTRGVLDADLRDRTRIRIDSETGTVESGALVVAEELWTHGTGRFQIIQRLRIDDETVRSDHISILQASAAAVHSLGADRQRGFGWVSVAPDGVDWDDVLRGLEHMGVGG